MNSTPFADAGERHLLVKAPPSGREDPAGAVEVALADMAGIVADLVAERVLERVTPLLGLDSTAEELVDAREIARRTGRSRWWVYEHAPELGAIKLGTGSNPRLAFSPARVQAYLAACSEPRDPQPAPSACPRNAAGAPSTRPQATSSYQSEGPVSNAPAIAGQRTATTPDRTRPLGPTAGEPPRGFF
jgi:hypothetical protein